MKKKTRKIVKTEPVSMADGIKIFFQTARLDLIDAVRANCRRKFPKTVEVLDGLSQAETEAVRNGGLLSLPQLKVSSLENAMLSDGFKWA